jgi:hypothetical protein
MRSWNLPKIRIYYCLIIINAYYKYIINAQYNYYNSNKVLLEECDKEVSVPVTGGCYCFLFEKKTVKRLFPMSRIRPVTKRRFWNVLSIVMYSPSYQKKTVKRSVQCHVFAQLPKEDYNVLSSVTYSPCLKKMKLSVQCHVFAPFPPSKNKTLKRSV